MNYIMNTITFKKGVFKAFLFTAIMLLLSVSLHSVQAQNCSAPAAPNVNWSGCDKQGNSLPFSNLSGANLSGANLISASLGFSNLSGANLSGANLSSALLPNVSLTNTNLTNANLTNAYLDSANLTNANLTGANLSGATLTGVVSGGIIGTPSALPAGWQLINGYLVTPLTAIQSQVNTFCNGACNGSAKVVASGGVAPYTYSWSPSGGTAATASGLCAFTYTCTITDFAGSTITKSFTITQPSAIVVSAASQTNVSCNGGSNGAASINMPTGGEPGYTYDWTPGTPAGDGTRSVTGLSAGTWTCTVTDNNGCTATKTFTITQPSAIVVSADPQSSVYCYTNNNGAASINIPTGGTGPYTYNWTSNINPTTFNVTRSVTGLRAGPVYTCTVMDSNGCTKSLDFIINTELSVSADTQTNVSCNGGNNGAAKVSGFGGARTAPEYGYYFDWTPGNPTGDGTRSVTGLSAGTWTCTVTDGNGCTKTQTFTITQPSAIAVSAASQTNVSCNGGSNGAASVNTSGGTPGYTYNWTPGNPTGDGTPSVTGLSAGTWTCTVTDANSCTKTQTFTITQPSAIVVSAASQTNVSCNGGSNGSASVTPSGGAGGYTYYWSPSGGTAATATGLSAGTWTCTVTDANSCTATSTFIITEPSPLEVSAASQTNEFCYRGYFGSASINIPTGGTAPYTYDWTPGNPTGDGTRSVNFLSAGTWTCTVTDNNGCTATLNFTITEPSPLQVSAASQTNVSCNGQNNGAASVNTTGGTPGYIYNWNPQPSIGAGTPSVSGLSAGTWTCYVTDMNGCYKTQEFYITVNDIQAPVISCPANITNVVATSAAGAVVNYSTPVGTDNCTGAITTRIAGLASGDTFPIGVTTVTHRVTDAAGLTAECSFDVTVVGVAPELECTGNIFVSNDAGQCGAIVTFDTFGTLGIPAALVTYSTSSGATTSGSVFPVGTTYVTATATNDFGSSSCSFGIYVNDADSPVISCQADITGVVATSAAGAVVNYTIPVGTDNCTVANTTRIAGLASGATFPIGVTTVTHRVTDAAGLTAECSFNVTVTGAAPAITCPANISVNNTTGQCGAAVTFAATETVGSPASVITYSIASGSSFSVGTTTVTATATNAVGSSSCTFTVTVNDTQAPVINCPANIVVSNDANQCGATVNVTSPIVLDNCGTKSLTFDGVNDLVVCPEGVVPTTGDFTVSVWAQCLNNKPYRSIFSQGRNLYLDHDSDGYIRVGDTWLNTGVLFPTDMLWHHYSIVSTSNDTRLFIDGALRASKGSAIDSPDQNAYGMVWPYNLLIGCQWSSNEFVHANIDELQIWNTALSASDINTHKNQLLTGNEAGLVGYYNFEDGPGSSVLTNLKNNTNNGSLVNMNTSSAWIGSPILINVTNSFNQTNDASGVYPIGTTAITWTATDASGNTATCNQTVTVNDTEAPTISCQGNITGVVATSAAGAVVNYTTPVGTDNCTGAITTRTAGLASGDTFPIGTTTVTHLVTDAAGLTASCSFDITVVGVAPAITCPGNISVNNDANQCGAAVTFAATETVGIPAAVITYSTASGATASGSNFPVGTTQVTATATNAVGSSSCSFDVIVNDTEAPSITCPIAVTVNANEGQCYATNVLLGLSLPIAIINPDFEILYKAGSTAVTSPLLDIRKFASGITNSNMAGPTVTFSDGSTGNSFDLPGWTFNAPNSLAMGITNENSNFGIGRNMITFINGETFGGGSAEKTMSQTLAENLQQNTSYTLTADFGWRNDNSVASPPVLKLYAGATLLTPIASNSPALVKGSFVSYTRTYLINNNAISGPLRIEFGIDANTNGQQLNTDHITLSKTLAIDNCAIATVIPTLNGNPVTAATQFPVGNNTVIWTATDTASNTVTCNQTITVNDTQAPMISCQADITNVVATSAAGAVVNYTTPVGTDNCTGATTTRTAGLASGDTFPIGTTTVTHRVIDAAGLTAECSFTVTVIGVAPELQCNLDTFVSNDAGQCGAIVTFDTFGTLGIPAALVTYSTSSGATASGSVFPVGTTYVTATTTNAIGSSSCSFGISVYDEESPVISCPANISATSNIGCATAVVVGTATATDNCGVDHVSGVRSDALALNALYPVGVTTITWTATDIHGNDSAICEQTVTVTGQQAVTSIPSQTICSGLSMSNIAVSGGVLGTTYSWTRDHEANVTGIAASGSGDISGGVLTNTTTVPVTVTFTITPNYNGCAGKSITAIVIVNPKAETPVISGNAPFCQGSSVTLDAGSGYASYSWSNGATTQTTAVSNATPVSVSVTNSFGCSATSLSVTPVVNTLSVAPTSITPSVAIATPGSNFTLSVNGGSLGTAANWKWYTASCGGTLVGIGASISVSQMVNTTYYVRAEGTCNTTACASVTVNIKCGASVITSSVGTTNVCPGTVVTLTPVGALSTGAQWRWDDDCDAVPSTSDASATYTTASSFTVTPTKTTTYYLQSVGGACGVTACLSVTVNVIAKPATPGTIGGLAIVCPSTSGTYSIAAVANATSYTWTAPTNATMVVAANGLSVVLTYNSAFVSGTLSVKANNCAGSSTAKTLAITKTAVPATPGTITGLASVCPNTSGAYSIATVANATSYTWTAPANASITAGQGTASVTVLYASGFTTGTLSVKATGCGGTSAAKTLTVTKTIAPATPATISGLATVCASTSGNYGIVAVANATSYTWIAPANATITAGQGTTSVTVSYASGFTSGTLSVTATGCGGTSIAKTLAISKTAIPATPGAIAGASPACAGSTQTYSITAVTNATSYSWTLPTGMSYVAGTITSGTSIQVALANTFSGGTLSVKATNCSGSSANVSRVLTASALPTSAGTITGPITVCKGAKLLTYSVAAAAGFTFNWSVPAGAVITAGAGTNSIKVTWGTVSGNVSVTKVNACGSSVASTLAVSSATCRETEDVVAPFAVIAYPNPFTDNFSLDVTTSLEDKIEMKVYDMIGKLIETRFIEVSEIANQEVGNNYAAGVYNIVVTQGAELKTLRVIKR